MCVLGSQGTTQMPGQPHAYNEEGQNGERGSSTHTLRLSTEAALQAHSGKMHGRRVQCAVSMAEPNTVCSDTNAG